MDAELREDFADLNRLEDKARPPPGRCWPSGTQQFCRKPKVNSAAMISALRLAGQLPRSGKEPLLPGLLN